MAVKPPKSLMKQSVTANSWKHTAIMIELVGAGLDFSFRHCLI
jgi:hypothetical protein